MRASAIDSHARIFPSRSWVLNSKVSFSAASKDYQMGRYTQSLATLNQLMDIQPDAKTYALLAKNLVQLGFKADAAKPMAWPATAKDRIPTNTRNRLPSCITRPAMRTMLC